MKPAYAPMQLIKNSILSKAEVSLSVLRLDLLDTFSSVGSSGIGNKYFKLKLNIEQAINNHCDSIVSFGGAYSNHLHALAHVGQHYGIQTIGVIRGEPAKVLNPTLKDAETAGMRLEYVSRETYKRRYQADYIETLKNRFENCYVLPEGGSNNFAVEGCKEIVRHVHQSIDQNYDVIALACGTGGTMAGVVAEAPMDKTVIGFSVLKSAYGLNDDVSEFLSSVGITESCPWHIEHDYHGGGYAKLNESLYSFTENFAATQAIPRDYIYTAKACYGLFQKIQQGDFKKESRIIFIHTGGLQGNRGMEEKIKSFTQQQAINV
jgi:1-aminocyclopropane-1-carboxylate deaminase